jgi:amino acid adenylation domain-containing protein
MGRTMGTQIVSDAAGEAGRETLWARFAAVAAADPLREAVRWDGGSLSYGALLDRACAIAGALRARGDVGRGARVGVALQREGDLVAALLGVIACGAAYVPLDTRYPADRLAFMVADSGAVLVLSNSGVALPPGVPRLDLDGACLPETAREPRSEPGSDDLAYVIYTSGSTGLPKGVEIRHASVVALIDWAVAAFSVDERGGMLASTSVCFDLSVFEIFVPLASGGRVLLADDVLALPDLPFRDEVRLINTVPSAMAELVAAEALPLAGRTVALAGEAFPAKLARQLGAAGAARVLNLYGPTEDTVYSAWAEVDTDASEAPPIGRPLPGTRAYVIGDDGQRCGEGEPGELHLAGVGLARGYRNRPDQTAERFLPDRFAEAASARMYRTGDRVCWRADGQLQYIGRLDDQVKVHGRRIELGEIEQALGLLPGVADCAVTVAEGPGGLPALVGYVAGTADAQALRAGLAATLPDWMVPALFVQVATIPRSLNGKRERKRLPAPVWPGGGDAGVEPAAALSDREATIVALFAELLGNAAVPDKSFVDQGGDSLLAVRLRARLGRELGIVLPLAALFEGATPRTLAALPAAARPDADADAAAAGALSPLQLQMWLAAQLEPDDPSDVVTARIAIEGPWRFDLLERSLAHVIARQPALRTRFVSTDGEPRQEVLAAAACRLARIDLADAADAEAGVLAVLAGARFPLSSPPLLRATLADLPGGRAALCIAAHHLVFDEWSLAIFVRDLADAYAALLADPAPPVGAAGQGAPSGSGPTASLVGTLPPEGLSALKQLARACQATPFIVLLAAFEALIAEESGAARVETLTAAAGREADGAEARIGCFVRMVPVSVTVEPSLSFRAWTAATRAAVLAALDRPPTPTAGEGRWQRIAFGLQNAPAATAVAGDLRFTASEVRPQRAVLPLTVWADERSGALRLLWTYREDRFDRDEIERLRRRYEQLLLRALDAPDTPLRQLARADNARPVATRRFPGTAALHPIGHGALANWGSLAHGRLPAVARAQAPGVDPAHWAVRERAAILAQLRDTGGVLLRGFATRTVGDFCRFVEALSPHLIHYSERSSPRTEIATGVYTSTDHPPDQPIVLHTEQSYTLNWPMRILFWCETAPTDRGRTPIADTRGVLSRLSPPTVAAFEARGIRYVRNYIPGISLSWQDVFQTEDRAVVESFCRAEDIAFEWLGEDRLRTSQRRPAIRRHPDTGERLWFNHGYFFNLAALPVDVQQGLRASLAEADYPYHTYFGDGGAIPAAMLEEIRAAYDSETVAFDWQQGDILLLDNMRVAHGREPFSGERRIRTAMTDPIREYAPASVAAPAGLEAALS